jgi:hypothetical protein
MGGVSYAERLDSVHEYAGLGLHVLPLHSHP